MNLEILLEIVHRHESEKTRGVVFSVEREDLITALKALHKPLFFLSCSHSSLSKSERALLKVLFDQALGLVNELGR